MLRKWVSAIVLIAGITVAEARPAGPINLQATNGTAINLTVNSNLVSTNLIANLANSTNLPGSAVQAGTINSNKFDANTLTALGSGGGGGVSAATATNIAQFQAQIYSTNGTNFALLIGVNGTNQVGAASNSIIAQVINATNGVGTNTTFNGIAETNNLPLAGQSAGLKVTNGTVKAWLKTNGQGFVAHVPSLFNTNWISVEDVGSVPVMGATTNYVWGTNAANSTGFRLGNDGTLTNFGSGAQIKAPGFIAGAIPGFSGDGSLVVNLNGGSIQAGTINSNKFDANTLTALGSGGGGISVVPGNGLYTNANGINSSLFFAQSGLSQYRSSIANTITGRTNTDVLLMIDSTGFYGAGGITNTLAQINSMQSNVTAYLYQMIPNARLGWMGSHIFNSHSNNYDVRVFDSTLVIPTNWNSFNADSIGGDLLISDAGTTNAIAYSPSRTVSGVKVVTYCSNGGGNCNLNVILDGSTTLATIPCSSLSAIYYITNLTFSSGIHTIYLQPTNATSTGCYAVGMVPYETNSINIINAAWESSTTANWLENSSAFNPLPMATNFAPRMLIVDLGLNDYNQSLMGSYSNNLYQIVTNFQGKAQSSVVLCVPWGANSGFDMTQLSADVYGVAALLNCPVIDFNKQLTNGVARGENFDTLHPNAIGYADSARAALSVFEPILPATSVGTGGAGTVTSVGLTVPPGMSVANSPVTGSGTIAVTYANPGAVPLTNTQSGIVQLGGVSLGLTNGPSLWYYGADGTLNESGGSSGYEWNNQANVTQLMKLDASGGLTLGGIQIGGGSFASSYQIGTNASQQFFFICGPSGFLMNNSGNTKNLWSMDNSGNVIFYTGGLSVSNGLSALSNVVVSGWQKVTGNETNLGNLLVLGAISGNGNGITNLSTNSLSQLVAPTPGQVLEFQGGAAGNGLVWTNTGSGNVSGDSTGVSGDPVFFTGANAVTDLFPGSSQTVGDFLQVLTGNVWGVGHNGSGLNGINPSSLTGSGTVPNNALAGATPVFNGLTSTNGISTAGGTNQVTILDIKSTNGVLEAVFTLGTNQIMLEATNSTGTKSLTLTTNMDLKISGGITNGGHTSFGDTTASHIALMGADNNVTNLTLGANLTLTGTTLAASGGGSTVTFNPSQFSNDVNGTNIYSGATMTNVIFNGLSQTNYSSLAGQAAGMKSTNGSIKLWPQTNGQAFIVAIPALFNSNAFSIEMGSSVAFGVTTNYLTQTNVANSTGNRLGSDGTLLTVGSSGGITNGGHLNTHDVTANHLIMSGADNNFTNLTIGANLSLSGTTLSATSGGSSTFGGQLYTATANVTVANTAATISLIGSGVGSLIIPANSMSNGAVFHIRGHGFFSTKTVTPGSITFQWFAAGNVIANSGGVNPSGGLGSVPFDLIGDFTVRTIGSFGTMTAQASIIFGNITGADTIVLSPSTTSIDTTADTLIDFIVAWQTADPANSITINQFVLDNGQGLGAQVLGVNQGGTGLSTVTSGGILYGSSATSVASSGALTAHAVVVGGGAGTAPLTVATGTSGQFLKSLGSGTDPAMSALALLGTVGVSIDGGGSAITACTNYIVVPDARTINSVTALADQSGTVAFDVYRCTYANFDASASHPVVAGDKISSGSPGITSATKSQDSTLSGWTTSLNAGDVLAFVVSGTPTSITKLVIQLKTTTVN